jgi:hypothetical protein
MMGIVNVVRGTGFDTGHSPGVVSALVVIALGVVLFGGVWLRLHRLDTSGQPVPTVHRLTSGPDEPPDAAPVSTGVTAEGVDQVSVDQVSVDRETTLVS